MLYWEREWKAWQDAHQTGEPLRLSLMVPIAFHTGRGPWQTNRQLGELMAGPEDDILQQINAMTDPERLNQWFRQAVRARSLDELQL